MLSDDCKRKRRRQAHLLRPRCCCGFPGSINRQQISFEGKAKEVQSWIDKYNTLLSRMGEAKKFEALRETVRLSLQKGDFTKATSAQEQIIVKEEKEADQLAQDLYAQAEMFVLQLRLKDAVPYYARAFHYRPYDPIIAEAYARALCDINRNAQARTIFQMSSDELRDLVDAGEQQYLPNLSCMLTNLGGIYYDNGDYKSARLAAADALRYAQRIEPSDDAISLEHVADALTGEGLADLGLGDKAGASELAAALGYYDRLQKATISRVLASEALAFEEQRATGNAEAEDLFQGALTYASQMLQASPYDTRSIYARVADELFLLLVDHGDLQRRSQVANKVREAENTVSVNDPSTKEFLRGLYFTMMATEGLLAGNTKGARSDISSALDQYEPMQDQLRPKESSLYAAALNVRGWINMLDGEYHSANADFNEAVSKNRFAAGPQTEGFREDLAMSNFFVMPFQNAYHELSHSAIMTPLERDEWAYVSGLREKLDVNTAIPETVSGLDRDVLEIAIQAQDGMPNGLADFERVSVGQRCRIAFFAGEVSLARERANSAVAWYDKLCPKATYKVLYSWLVLAERRRQH